MRYLRSHFDACSCAFVCAVRLMLLHMSKWVCGRDLRHFTSPSLTFCLPAALHVPHFGSWFCLPRLFLFCLFARLAQQLDPLLPVAPSLNSIETDVKRLAKLVDTKVTRCFRIFYLDIYFPPERVVKAIAYEVFF